MIDLRKTNNRTTGERLVHRDMYTAYMFWLNASPEHSIDLVYDDGQVFSRRHRRHEWVGGAFGGPAK